MSDWQNKSDFEINLAVAKLMPPIVSENQSASLKSRASSVLVNDIVSEWEFNPCNNPSDAWPVIEGKIEIQWISDSHCCAIVWDSEDKPVSSGLLRKNKALRAAMIVYLEMNGVKP